jgi:hypothetical protein
VAQRRHARGSAPKSRGPKEHECAVPPDRPIPWEATRTSCGQPVEGSAPFRVMAQTWFEARKAALIHFGVGQAEITVRQV